MHGKAGNAGLWGHYLEERWAGAGGGKGNAELCGARYRGGKENLKLCGARPCAGKEIRELCGVAAPAGKENLKL